MTKTLEHPSDRADSDQEEALLRMGLALAGLAFFLLAPANSELRRGLLVAALYFAWTSMVWMAERAFKRPSAFRRIVALCMDQTCITAAVQLSGLAAAPLLFGYLWVILGSTMRYGARYGVGAALGGIAGLAALALANPEWRHGHPGLFYTWLLNLAVAPAYIGLLRARLAQSVERYRAHSQQLAIAATHDRMTGLPNREHFERTLETALERLRAAGSGALAVLFVDLDGFKSCNDLYGHAAGDEILCLVADDLRDCIRASDVAARFGGDEFAILLTGLRSVEDAARIVSTIIRRARLPRTVGGHAVRISASAGISYVRAADAATLDSATLIARADRAMLRAKRSGKSTFRLATGPQAIAEEFDLLAAAQQDAA